MAAAATGDPGSPALSNFGAVLAARPGVLRQIANRCYNDPDAWCVGIAGSTGRRPLDDAHRAST
jgi:hypothetical protein